MVEKQKTTLIKYNRRKNIRKVEIYTQIIHFILRNKQKFVSSVSKAIGLRELELFFALYIFFYFTFFTAAASTTLKLLFKHQKNMNEFRCVYTQGRSSLRTM